MGFMAGNSLQFKQEFTEPQTYLKSTRDFQSYNQILGAIIENANIWINVLDNESNVVIWNKAAEILSGYSREEVLGDTKIWSWLYPDPKYREQILNSVACFFQEVREEQDVETTIRRKDGQSRIISWNTKSVLNENDKVIGTIAIGRDITDRRQIEALLVESEEQYRALYENSIDGILLTSIDGRILAANPAACGIYQRSAEELRQIGRNGVIDLTDPRLPAVLQERIRTGKFRGELNQKRKDGTTFPAEISTSVFKDKDGHELTSLVIRDITERKRAEENLKRYSAGLEATIKERTKELQVAREQLKHTIESNPAAIYTAKPLADHSDWVIAYISDNIVETTGFEPKEFIGHPEFWAKRAHPDDLRQVMAQNLRIFKDGKGAIEYRFLHKDGTYRWVRDQVNVTFDAEGKPVEVNGCWMNVTELKRSEAGLQESERRYRELFEAAPVSLWEEDFSEVKAYCKKLRESGVTDFNQYFSSHPEAITRCMELVKVLRVNASTLKLYCARGLDEFAKGLNQIMPPEARGIFKDEVLALVDGKSEFAGRGDNKTLLGETKHISLTCTVVPGYEETLEKVLVSITDLTELKATHEAIREVKEQLEQVIELNPAVIYTAKPLPDLHYYPTYMSRNVVSLVGFEAEKFIGPQAITFWESRVHPNDLAQYRRETPQLWKDKNRSSEYRFQRKDGEYCWIREEINVVRDSNGNALDIIGLWTDVTEKKRIDELEANRKTEMAKKLNELTDNLESLAKIRDKLKTVPDTSTGLDTILETVLWNFGLDCGAVLFLDHKTNRATVRASRARAKQISLNGTYPVEGIVELKGLQTKSITRIVGKEEKSILGTRIVHIIPLLAGSEVYGVLAFGNDKENSLENGDTRILELYADLTYSFVNERSTVLTPVLESKATTNPFIPLVSNLELGEMYLFKNSTTDAAQVFVNTVFAGHQGLCITRMYPPKVRDKYGLQKTPIVWLTNEAIKGEQSVHSIQDLSIVIASYLEKAEKAVVLIDGFEYLITNHGFEAFLTFLQILKSRVQRRNAIVIAPLFEQTIASQQLALIQREMKLFGKH